MLGMGIGAFTRIKIEIWDFFLESTDLRKSPSTEFQQNA